MATPAKIVLAALLCLLPASSVFAIKVERLARVSPSAAGSSFMEVASGLVSVTLVPGVSTSAASSALELAGFSIDLNRASGRWHPVYFLQPMPVSQALSVLGAMVSIVEKVEPDKVYRIKRVPNDPGVPLQYALSQIQAFGAWEYETGTSSRVTVAVIDTGVESTHPEFSGKFADSISQFCDPGADKNSSSGNIACAPETPVVACYHGTSVAGVAAATGNNSIGVAGLSWNARLVSLRVFRTADCNKSDCGGAACGTDDWAMADAFNFLATKQDSPEYGKIVANLSVGCPVDGTIFSCGTCNPVSAIGTAIANAISKGVLVFAAAGNEGNPNLDTPADCPGVVAVGATDSQDKLAAFSNTDSTMTYKGITAPGVSIYTTDLNGGYASVSGTSFSTPLTSGLAALIWSAKPSYSAAQVWDTLKNSADDLGAPGPDRDFGWGRINALKALRLAETGAMQFAGTRKAVAYPNPFRPKSQRLVTFTVPADLTGAGVEVKIYTSEGELVKKLDGLAWDGRNAAGLPVASGVYFFRIKTDKDSATGRFALLR